MKQLFLFFSCLLLSYTLHAQTPAYSLVKEIGIWFERVDSIRADEMRQTADNTVFQKGFRFVYRYYYLGIDGKKYLQKVDHQHKRGRDSSWMLVPMEEKDALTNDLVAFMVEEGPGNAIAATGVVQTQIKYEFLSSAGKLKLISYTGLVENKKNIWLHPPRTRLFKILQLNPFPFIQAPYVVGHQWSWELVIGPGWGDPRWKDWDGSITNRYQYKITGEKVLDTPVGRLKCLEISSTATSRIGTTALTAYFHPEWGFVLLDYTNIDGTKLVMELLRREFANALTKPFIR